MTNKRTLKKIKAKNLPKKPVLSLGMKRNGALSEFAVGKITENIKEGLALAKSYRSLGISDKNFQ